MKRETIYKIQKPVSAMGNSDSTNDPTSAEPLEQIGDGIGAVIEGITDGVCGVIYGVCDVINNLALDITIAGATLAGAKD